MRLGGINRAALQVAMNRVWKIANGAMINTTYRLSPFDSLAAFKSDLKLILEALHHEHK